MGALSLLSCTKQETELVSIRFAVGEYGYFPTKGMADAIGATLPESLDLTIKNTSTGATYTTATGQDIEVPVGTYTITGTYTPEATKLIHGYSVFLSHSPKVSISQEVEVTAGQSVYALTANYESLALAIVGSEVTKWQGSTGNREGFEVESLTEGIYEWTFLSGDLGTDKYFHTTLTPADGTASKGFTIIANPEMQMNFSDALLVEPGKWYILRVSDAEIQAGSFAVEWPEWTQG